MMENMRQSQFEHTCQKCGGEVAPYKIGRFIYPKICQKCDHAAEQTAKALRDKAAADAEQRRLAALQRQHDEEITRRLDTAVPRRFAGAEMEHLSAGLIEKFNTLPDGNGLFLFGPAGCGKSYAMAAFAKKFIRDDVWPVMVINWERFISGLRASYSGVPGQADRMIQGVLCAAVLFIDDAMLTGGQESDFSLKTMYTIIDYRAENMLPTHFAANRAPDDLSVAFDERIKSRVLGYCKVVRIQGMDRRLSK
jgi:DNA replication protein DnaC